MKEEIDNEKDLKALEEEIRALGIPYSENEPDERYFANFRVRLSERIEEKEKKQGIVAGAWQWLVASPLRYLSLSATLAGVAVAVFLLRPASQPQIAAVQPVQQRVEAPSATPVTPKQIKPDIAIAPNADQAKPKRTPKTGLAVKEPSKTIMDAVSKAGDLASIDASLTSSEQDDPVNLENLSESELESVIAIVRDMK